jgi:hypothetical protein
MRWLIGIVAALFAAGLLADAGIEGESDRPPPAHSQVNPEDGPGCTNFYLC